MNDTTTTTNVDPAMLEKLKETSAWREMEANASRQRLERRRDLAALRQQVLARKTEEPEPLRRALEAAKAKTGEAREAVEEAERAETEAAHRLSRATHRLDQERQRLEAELRRTAPPEIGELVAELDGLAEKLRRNGPAEVTLPLQAGSWTNASEIAQALETIRDFRRQALEDLTLEPEDSAVLARAEKMREAAQAAVQETRKGPGETPEALERMAQERRAARDRALYLREQARQDREARERRQMREYQTRIKAGWVPERERDLELRAEHRKRAAALMRRVEAEPDSAA